MLVGTVKDGHPNSLSTKRLRYTQPETPAIHTARFSVHKTERFPVFLHIILDIRESLVIRVCDQRKSIT
jgi:hypothetical protein